MRHPVQVGHVFQYRFATPTDRLPRISKDGHPVGGTLVKDYWQAASPSNGKIRLTCGHKHHTQEAAEKCLEPTRKKYHELRYGVRRGKD